MFTAEALLDLHGRTHSSLVQLLDHCAEFADGDLDRELDGFGYATIRLQLHHVVVCERYWVGVLRGLMLADENAADHASIEALRSFRTRVAAATEDYLRSATPAELSSARRMTTWGDIERDLVPGRVIYRTQTHIFHHQGQIAAMARLLGRPIPQGLDFPVD